MTSFKVADIQPNPFRHMDRYPIRREKVDALKESISTTTFWDNIVARINPSGQPEIAYGHHRLVALREQLGPTAEVSLIVRELDDEQMLKIMARENLEEWGSSVAIEHETIRAVVEAYGAGQIELPAPARSNGSNVRYAPSFAICEPTVGSQIRPYTSAEVADFLGWVKPNGRAQDKVNNGLSALEFIEEGILSEADFDGLGTEQARSVVEQARQVRRRREEAAREAERAAENAARQAEDAERRRLAAETARRDAAVRAQAAQEQAEREQAEREQAVAAKRAHEAQQEREAAERAQTAQAQKAEQERQAARIQATAVGQRVSKDLRSGAIGRAGAAESARDELGKMTGSKVPPGIDDFAMKLAAKLLKILEPDAARNKLTADTELFITYRGHATERSRKEVAHSLSVVAERASTYASQLMTDDDAGPAGEIERA